MGFRDDLIDVLNEEWEFFGQDMAGGDKTVKVGTKVKAKETVEPFASRIGDYWLSLPSSEYNRLVSHVAKTYGKLDGTITSLPWSAAFISYCMQSAGAGSQFPYAAGHATWIVKSIKNRQAGKIDAPLVGYPIGEHPLAPGDLIGAGRKDGAAVTYDTAVQTGWFLSHSDIIVEIDKAKGLAYAIGGNVGQSVAKTSVKIDKDGRLISEPDKRPWMVHIQNNIRSALVASAPANLAELRVG